MAYHVIHIKYVGPNCGADKYRDTERYEVRNRPPSDIDGNTVTEGALGEKYGTSYHTLGAYETLDAAEQAIQERLATTGYRRETPQMLPPMGDDVFAIHRTGNSQPVGWPFGDKVFARYRIGNLRPMGWSESREWVWDSVIETISATSTDADIATWVDDMADIAATEASARLDTDAVHQLAVERRSDSHWIGDAC